MLNQLWMRISKGEKSGKLSERLQSQLRGKYNLDSQTLRRLMYVSKPGLFAGNKTKYLRIYDPSLMDSADKPFQRYKDLTAAAPFVLFECRIDGGDMHSIKDYRKSEIRAA